MLSRTSCSERKTDGSYTNRPFCAARWRKRQEHRRKAAPQLIFFCFFSSKKKRRGRFLFLKKRNKRHCGAVDLSVNRCFPACPARNKKTDGSYVNRPFCAARWRKRQEHRRKAAPQLIFFCFFSSKKKRSRIRCRFGSTVCILFGRNSKAEGVFEKKKHEKLLVHKFFTISFVTFPSHKSFILWKEKDGKTRYGSSP